jgi:capsular polysaccharide transport system permease protein
MFDRFDPTGLFSSFEDLYRYYLNHVVIDANATTSVSTLTVRAYTAEDALKFNQRLLEMAEATVNRLNLRGREDMIRFASVEVDDTKAKARDAALALAAFRNRSGIIEPAKQAEVQMQMISKLQDQLITTRTQLMELVAFTPQNPQIPVFRTRVASLEREINRELARISGGQGSIAASSAQFQRLLLESQFADKQLTAALASLEDARNEARRKQAYVERIVNPNLPDSPAEPRRLRGILATFLLGLVAWAIAYMLYAGIREHGQ